MGIKVYTKAVFRPVRLAVAGMAVSATLAGTALAGVCPAPDEQDSLTVRALQARLMVAALSCQARDDYNQFVGRYERHLAGHAVSLRKWFRKLHGSRSEREINRYVTGLANDASMLSIRDRAKFCVRSRDAFAALLEAPRKENRSTLRSVAMATRWVRSAPPECDALTQKVD